MIAVLIPARNEETMIGNCLRSVLSASNCRALGSEEVRIVVSVDRCTDSTKEIAQSFGVDVIEKPVRNVGEARAAAAAYAIARGARWLAMTDADTTVPVNWLSAQLEYSCDAFCGIVAINDWADYGDRVKQAFERAEISADGHPHVHGANLGVSTELYLRAGGFRPLEVGEDVALVEALMQLDADIARKPTPIVLTSARRVTRAKGGFGDYLKNLEREVN